MRQLSRQAIRRYVLRENPIDCVGGLKIESSGISLVESVVGPDPSAIIGLPLVRLVTLLRKFGVVIG